MFCGKACYAISLYRCVECIYGGSRRKIEFFVWETSRSMAFYFSPQFLVSRRCNRFYDCNIFGSLGEVFAHGGEFPLSFLIVVGLGHRVEFYCWPVTAVTVLWRAREDIRLISSTTKYDGNVSFRAIDLIWGIWTLTAELVCFARVITPPCPYPVRDQ